MPRLTAIFNPAKALNSYTQKISPRYNFTGMQGVCLSGLGLHAGQFQALDMPSVMLSECGVIGCVDVHGNLRFKKSCSMADRLAFLDRLLQNRKLQWDDFKKYGIQCLYEMVSFN